jgi:hypothetical protein
MHAIRTTSLLLGFLILSALVRPAAAEPPELSLARSGRAEVVYSWRAMRCEDSDVPDTPARAWRDAAGQVHLLASHATNRAMIGPDLDHLKQDCRVVFKGSGDAAPEHYDDRSWITSPYTIDGTTVFALVHNEYHGNLRPERCPSRNYMRCWSNAVTMAVSHDGGLLFRHEAPPSQLVAGLPYRYAGDVGHRTGYFNPSNIVGKDGFYYVLLFAEAQGAQRRGACLMRTNDLADRRSWRAWDGTAFSIRFSDPYAEDMRDPAQHVCAPIAEGKLTSLVSSVTLHRSSGLYIALMATARPAHDREAPVTGIFAATSADLIHWSDPALLWQAPVLFKYECGADDIAFYPSLLDPASPTRNFEDTGDRSYIYLTQIHPDGCRIGWNRDLVRVPVTIGAAARPHG